MYDWIKVSTKTLPIKAMQGCALACWLVIVSRCDEDGYSTISYGRIASITGYARRSVINAVPQLEKLGLLERMQLSGRCKPLTCKILACASVGPDAPQERDTSFAPPLVQRSDPREQVLNYGQS